MARQPKPWYRADRKVWCVTINRKRHNLGHEKKEALKRFYAMMRQPQRIKVAVSDTLPTVIDAFLDWTHRNRSAATYRWYRDHLQRFIDRYASLPIEQLRPFHVEAWASEQGQNVNTRRNRMRAVKRCLRWAVGQGHIENNPLSQLEIPAAHAREVFVSEDEFQTLLGFVRDQGFVDLLRVTYETGCRPQESLRVEARHLDAVHSRWVFPPRESKGKSMPRVVYLTQQALEVSAQLAAATPHGPLFRNSHGKPWSPFSVSCAFDRIQTRMGLEEFVRRGESISDEEVSLFIPSLADHRIVGGVRMTKTGRDLVREARRKLTARRARELAPRYSLYVLRHSWATNALQRGVDALTVAILMGHRDPSTLARTYQHLSHNPSHLLEQARRAGG